MNPTVRNIIAVISGVFLGGGLNMIIIMVSSSIIPPPEGADVTTMEGLQASMHLFTPVNFIMPFLAHALGSLAGAFIAARFAASNNMPFAIGVGAWYLLGGIINVMLLPSPVWFAVVDLTLAYLPMAYLAGKIAEKIKIKNN